MELELSIPRTTLKLHIPELELQAPQRAVKVPLLSDWSCMFDLVPVWFQTDPNLYLKSLEGSSSCLLVITEAFMGTFIGHFVPAFALILLGLWHAINTIRAYCLRGSANFTVKFWHPFYGSLCKLKYLELIFILSFSVFAILVQLLDYPMFHFAFNLSNFEHATMFLHLGIFACFTLSAEIAGSSDILSGVSGILVASVFGQELFLLHFHSTDHVGLEGHYHWLLQLIVFVSLVSALAATSVPSSFPFALVLAISVVFQGCWFMIMGFVLWIPDFIPEGCFTQISDDMLGAVKCTSADADLRARALANMQFSWVLAGILLFTGCVCLKLTRRRSSARGNSYEYEKIQNVPIVIDVHP